MREILFRGKRVHNGEWVYGGFTLDAIDKPRITIKDSSGKGLEFIKVHPETVGQFTGLMDKNGTRIFEGDILSCINPNDGEIYTTGFIASLINGITFTNTKLTRELAMYECEWPDELQITSNIHDNPTT